MKKHLIAPSCLFLSWDIIVRDRPLLEGSVKVLVMQPFQNSWGAFPVCCLKVRHKNFQLPTEKHQGMFLKTSLKICKIAILMMELCG